MTDALNIPGEVSVAVDDGAGRSVSALVEAGLPLESGLRALSEEAPNQRLRRMLRRMSDELAAGTPAEDVLSTDGSGLPRYLRGLIRAGVQSGQLGSFLEEFLLAYRRRRSARRGFWMAMAYPLVLLPLSLVAVALMLMYIVPQFKDIFQDFGVELPWMTFVLIKIGDVLSSPVLIGLLIAILGLQGMRVLMPFLFGPAIWTRMVQRLPVIGTPSRMRGMSEFCSLLGLLVSGGIPLSDALEITSGAVQDPNLESGSRKLATRVAGGESMQQGAWNLPNFSAELRSLFHWETRGATFGEILRQAGRVYAARSQVQLGMVGMVFQPLILLVVGGFLAFTVIALFMPLIKLLNALS